MNPYGPKIRGKVDLKGANSDAPEKSSMIATENVHTISSEHEKLSTPAVGNHITATNIVFGIVVIVGLIWVCRWCIGMKSRNASTPSSERAMRNLMDRL